MRGVKGACCRIVGELMQTLGTLTCSDPQIKNKNASYPESETEHETCKKESKKKKKKKNEDEELMMRALTTVFEMESNGKIKKEKARTVVEKLGLVKEEDGGDDDGDEYRFELPGSGEEEDVVAVEEALGVGEASEEILREAFGVFDEDGNGYIDAVELKRVLQCLGLDKGWDMDEVEKMLSVVDLNFDGFVDFSEFQLMVAS